MSYPAYPFSMCYDRDTKAPSKGRKLYHTYHSLVKRFYKKNKKIFVKPDS